MSAPIAGYQQGNTYSASQDRSIAGAGMVSKLVAGTSVPYSVILLADMGANLDLAAPGGWAVTISSGSAMVAGYSVSVPASVTVTHDAATASPRRDLIILRVRDQEAGDLVDNATVEIVKGTTTADPAIPSRSLVLWEVNIPASVGSIIFAYAGDRRVFTSAVGGVVQVRSVAAGNTQALPPGTLVYNYADTLLYRTANSTRQLTRVVQSPPVMVGGHVPLKGTAPADPGTIKTVIWNNNFGTDVYGVAYVPTLFTQCLLSATASVTNDTVDVGQVSFLSRASTLATAAFFCYTRSNPNNGAAYIWAPLQITMVGV